VVGVVLCAWLPPNGGAREMSNAKLRKHGSKIGQ